MPITPVPDAGNAIPQAKRRSLLLAAAATVLPAGASAQAAWPSRPVRVIVPFPPSEIGRAHV